VIRFGAMKYYISRGHHVRRWDPILRKTVSRWHERRRERKKRRYSHVFIRDDETGGWKSPCGMKQATKMFEHGEPVLKGKNLRTGIDTFLRRGAPGFMQKRCMKCVAWLEKNGEGFKTAEQMGE